MKIVYLSGPYSAPNNLAIEQNILNAKIVACELARKEIGFFCPHLNSAHFQIYIPLVGNEFFLQLDLTILKWCDAILMLQGWEGSKGAKRELTEFSKYCRPIFYTTLNTVPFELLKWY